MTGEIERVAARMAETLHGGRWADYHETTREPWRRRAERHVAGLPFENLGPYPFTARAMGELEAALTPSPS